MIKILIVEDEEAISDLIRFHLTRCGYECRTCYDGMAAANLLEETANFDLILLDIMLPHINGYELMEYIRPLGIPVIFLTAKSTMNDKIKGLTSGAEDYIVKPFEVVELLARINIVLRRYHKTDAILIFDNIEIDTENRIVKKNGEGVDLTPKEFDLLLLLVRNKNMTLFRDKIYEQVWETEYIGETRTLDLHIRRLRKKLAFTDNLKTMYGVGYRLEDTLHNEV